MPSCQKKTASLSSPLQPEKPCNRNAQALMNGPVSGPSVQNGAAKPLRKPLRLLQTQRPVARPSLLRPLLKLPMNNRPGANQIEEHPKIPLKPRKLHGPNYVRTGQLVLNNSRRYRPNNSAVRLPLKRRQKPQRAVRPPDPRQSNKLRLQRTGIWYLSR